MGKRKSTNSVLIKKEKGGYDDLEDESVDDEESVKNYDWVKSEYVASRTLVSETNRHIVLFPWVDPVTDSKRITAIVQLPSGVVPEEVEFKFMGGNPFYADAFKLTYDWPTSCLEPKQVFKPEIKQNRGFRQTPEYLTFMSKVRKINSEGVSSDIEVTLPFRVQSSNISFEVKR